VVGGKKRDFNPKWFDEFGSWLEYSIEKDAAYCLYYFLFSSQVEGQQRDSEAFVNIGWNGWNKGSARLLAHVDGSNSIHMRNEMKGKALMNERQAIATYFQRQFKKSVKEYRERMIVSLDCIRFLHDI
jgi:hypothetical protein